MSAPRLATLASAMSPGIAAWAMASLICEPSAVAAVARRSRSRRFMSLEFCGERKLGRAWLARARARLVLRFHEHGSGLLRHALAGRGVDARRLRLAFLVHAHGHE